MSHLETARLLALAPEQPDLLTQEAAADARRHLEACPRCATDLVGLTAFLSAWREGCAAEPLPANPARFDAIRAALEPGSGDLAVRRLGPDRIPSTCVYCHSFASRSKRVLCRACRAPHHVTCFRTHGVCSTIGCGAADFDRLGSRDASSPAPRRSVGLRGMTLRLLSVAAVALVCAGGGFLLSDHLTAQVRGQVIVRALPAARVTAAWLANQASPRQPRSWEETEGELRKHKVQVDRQLASLAALDDVRAVAWVQTAEGGNSRWMLAQGGMAGRQLSISHTTGPISLEMLPERPGLQVYSGLLESTPVWVVYLEQPERRSLVLILDRTRDDEQIAELRRSTRLGALALFALILIGLAWGDARRRRRTAPDR